MSDKRDALKSLRELLKERGVGSGLGVGRSAGALQVRVRTPEDAGKVPKEWEGFTVQTRVVANVVAQDEFTVGWSPAIPDVVHRVKKSRMVGGGLVAKWQCERGRGETYGAATRPGSARDVTCEECRDA